MAVIHRMGHGGRRYGGAALSVKSFFGRLLLVVGTLFSMTTVCSLLLCIIRPLFSKYIAESVFISAMFDLADNWIDYLFSYIERVMELVKGLTDRADPHTWPEFFSALGLMLLAFFIVIGTICVILHLGKIIAYAGRKLNTPSSGEEGGLKGERDALKLLKRLPNDTHVFVNLEFEKRGHHETDFIITSPAGVTVCEVKYWSGRVIYDPDDTRDVIRKNSRGERSYMHSPVHQVTAHYETLRDALRDGGVRISTRGMVLMMHPNVSLEGFGYCPIPVLSRPTANEVYNLLGAPRLSRDQVEQVVRALCDIAV